MKKACKNCKHWHCKKIKPVDVEYIKLGLCKKRLFFSGHSDEGFLMQILSTKNYKCNFFERKNEI